MVEDDGAVGTVAEVVEGVLADADAGVEAGVGGAVDAVWSDVLDATSFFSPVVDTGASLPEDGFILSE